MQTRRILELTLGGAALVAVAVAVGKSLGSSGGDTAPSDAAAAAPTVDGALRWTTDTFLPVPTDAPVPPQRLLPVGVPQQ